MLRTPRLARTCLATLAAVFWLSACAMAHEPGLTDDPANPPMTSLCALPLEAPIRSRAGNAEIALFIDPASGACRLDCGEPDCYALGTAWVHVLTFESLPPPTRNRISNSFTGVGWFESASEGDLIGDGLLQNVPLNVRTEVVLRDDPARLEIEFRNDDGPVIVIHELVVADFVPHQ